MKSPMIAFFVLFSAVCFSAPLDKSHLPADTKWVFHLDIEAFKSGAFGQMVFSAMESRYRAKIAALCQLIGTDLAQDIEGLTLFGPDAEEANAVALIYGKYDREKLLALLALNPAYAEQAHGESTLYLWRDKGRDKNQVGAFASDNLIVISQRAEGVTAVLDALAGGARTLAADRAAALWSLTEGTQGAFVTAAADGLSALTQGNDHATLLQNARLMTFIADEKDGRTRLFTLLEANDIETARQIEQVVRGMLAFAMIKHAKDPQTAALLEACLLERADARLTAEFNYPSPELFAMIQRFLPASVQ